MISYNLFARDDRILMLALDHRGSMDKMLPAHIPMLARKETIIGLKQLLMETLSPLYSGVLFDSEYGLPAYTQSVVSTVINKPYLLCIEKTGYEDMSGERLTTLESSVSELKHLGARGIKLLLFYHPDSKSATRQIGVAKQVFEDCKKNELPFFLEILNYSLDGKPYTTSDLVPRSVKDFLHNGINADVFKLEFPGNADACAEVTTLLGKTPWILLTKGDTYDGFVASLKIAAANGARGFLAGRSIWQDFATLRQAEWANFIQTTVKKRFEEICRIASS
jgi:sulfofructosephosphate aldolase